MIRVLVVDDDPNVRFTVRVALEGSPPPAGEPMAIEEAGDGESALRAVERARSDAGEEDFDVVLLDIALPGMDGYEVLHRLRGGEDGEDPAVLMLTALTREIDIVNAYRAGADGYVTKPFDVDDLARLTRTIAMSPLEERVARRRRELERAELLLQLEHGFGAGPPATPTAEGG